MDLIPDVFVALVRAAMQGAKFVVRTLPINMSAHTATAPSAECHEFFRSHKRLPNGDDTIEFDYAR